MKYGYFNDERKEYVITTPKTPVKWINYIGGLSFGGFVDHTGGSLICKGDPALNRIVKYLPQLPASDFKGETLYIRWKDGDRYKLFSPYFVPTLDTYDRYECRVGLGYTTYISEFYGIRTEITVFVPLQGEQVIRDIRVTNISEKARDLDLIPVVEYTHFDALKQFTNADWVPQTMQSKAFKEEAGRIVLRQCAFMNLGVAENYFSSNAPVSSFETDRKKFLGENEYGAWCSPLALQEAELSNYEAQRGDNIAVLMHHLGSVQPGETKRLITQLGQLKNVEEEKERITVYYEGQKVEQAFQALKVFWEEYLSKMQVNTPDAAMNTMLNVHNARQCYITKNWSRYLSLYQLGFGARGLGFRDSSQDVMGILAGAPQEGKELIEKLLQIQQRDGSAMHQFNPLTMIASRGDSAEMEDRPNYYGDDHLWSVLAVCAYLRETGDMDFLQKEIPFYEKDTQGNPLERASVLEHLQRGIEFTHSNRGAHGLPLLGFADWNDTVNLPTGAESIFIAAQYGVAVKEMSALMQFLGKQDWGERYQSYYDEMKHIVNTQAWDGEWYLRYFDANGGKIGSKENQQGQIYTNAQSWNVMAGFAEGQRGETALNSVNRHLNTAKGIKLSAPGYNGYDPQKGGVSTYPPGTKENGGIFLHSNPWVMIAETMLGHGDRAFQYYNQINPASKNEDLDEVEVAPYNYPQNVLGDEHPQFGLGRNSWLSGTASWTYQAATQYILGIRPDYEGLQINPCIPANWDGFSVTRVFRGATYTIDVKNPEHVSQGIASILVDGEKINGNVLPIFQDGQEHEVEVVMGVA